MSGQLELELDGGKDDGMYSDLELVIKSSASQVAVPIRKRLRVEAFGVRKGLRDRELHRVCKT
jgi:hypothetical protein